MPSASHTMSRGALSHRQKSGIQKGILRRRDIGQTLPLVALANWAKNELKLDFFPFKYVLSRLMRSDRSNDFLSDRKRKESHHSLQLKGNWHHGSKIRMRVTIVCREG